MTKYKTNLSKFPKEILKESEDLINSHKYEILVVTDHGFTVRFDDEGKDVTTSLVFNNDGNLINYSCDCKKYSLCKHVGAVLKIIENNNGESIKRELTLSILKEDLRYEGKFFRTTTEFLNYFKGLVDNYTQESIVDTIVSIFPLILSGSNGYFLFKYFESLLSKNLPVVYYKILHDSLLKVNDILNFSTDLSEKFNSYVNNFFQDIALEAKDNKIIADLYFDLLEKGIKISKPIYYFLYGIANHSYIYYEELPLEIIDSLLSYDQSYYNLFALSRNYIPLFLKSIYKENNCSKEYIMKFSKLYYAFYYEYSEFLSLLFIRVVNIYRDIESGKSLLKEIMIEDSNMLRTTISELKNDDKTVFEHYILENQGTYNFFPISRDLNYAKEISLLNEPISLLEIKTLIKADYPFNFYRTFFDNKEIFISKNNEDLDNINILNLISTIVSNIQDTTLYLKLSTLIKSEDKLIKYMVENFDINYLGIYLSLDLLKELGYTKI